MNTLGHLLYFARFCAGSTPKTANKNVQQRTLPSFLTISLNLLCRRPANVAECNRMLLRVHLCPTGSLDTDDNNGTFDNGRGSCDLCSRERLVIGKS